MNHRAAGAWKRGSLLSLTLLSAMFVAAADAQDRLKSMPGYEQYQKMRREISGAAPNSRLPLNWVENGKALEFRKDQKTFRYDIAARHMVEIGDFSASAPSSRGRRGGAGSPGRGRQYDSALSPDGKRKAFYRDRNLYIGDAAGENATAITTEGNEKNRVKYGTASWVYGEELDQNTAMWWSPDGSKLAFYRFDESPVQDYFLQTDQTRIQSKLEIEAYPKAGAPNPVVDLFIYDTATQKTVQVDVRDGKPFANETVGYYVYRVMWSPDGKELLFHRTNRRQNILEFAACDPQTGKCRVIVREEWLPSWTDNAPEMRWLQDGKRFLWVSERSGWKNYYLYDLSGTRLATLTQHPFEVTGIMHVDEAAGTLYYLARSGDNPLKIQLHAVGLDGKNDKRLTDPALHHTVDVSPDGKHFVDTAQTHDTPPATRLLNSAGQMVAELHTGDLARFKQLGLKHGELFTFKAADGRTDLHGMLHFPSQFDPSRKYPLLVDIYGGPGWPGVPDMNSVRETFVMPPALTEYGFLVVAFNVRSASGYGKRFLDAIYGNLGVIADDVAAGVKALWDRPYVDKKRVGIYGTSFGGYVSALSLLRHPEVFQAASASSMVSSWHHYDTIYTERYMGIPQENETGYEASSVIRYADKLQGRLMIYYGTADNNTHPANSLQLIQALQKAGKSFEVQVGPDRGHSGLNTDRMMEFFIENLVLKTP